MSNGSEISSLESIVTERPGLADADLGKLLQALDELRRFRKALAAVRYEFYLDNPYCEKISDKWKMYSSTADSLATRQVHVLNNLVDLL